MLRTVLVLTLAAGCAGAATITTQVECNGEVSSGTTSAFCSNAVSIARASIGASPQYQDSVGFSIFADGGTFASPPPFVTFSASALFHDDYVLTVTGGSGAGSLLPCILATWDNFRGSGMATIDFGGSALGTIGNPRLGGVGSCEGSAIPSILFVFGVPQTISVSMSATARVGIAPSQVDDGATLSGFQFFDAAGQQLTNVHFTLVSASVPEPRTLVPFLAGLCFLWISVARAPAADRPIPPH